MVLNKVTFLEEIFTRLECKNSVLNFLVDQKLMTHAETQHFLNEHFKSQSGNMMAMLEGFKQEGKIQLLNYEWNVLPNLYMKLEIVGPTGSKEWVYER